MGRSYIICSISKIKEKIIEKTKDKRKDKRKAKKAEEQLGAEEGGAALYYLRFIAPGSSNIRGHRHSTDECSLQHNPHFTHYNTECKTQHKRLQTKSTIVECSQVFVDVEGWMRRGGPVIFSYHRRTNSYI